MACKVNGKWIFQIHIMIMLKSFSEIKFQHDWSFYQRLSHIGNDMHAWESWSSNTLVIWCEEPTHWKRPRCWEWLREGGEEGNRGWDGCMATPIQWTWIWENSGRWWGTGKPGMLQSMELQRVRHDLVTEQQKQSSQRQPEVRGSPVGLGLALEKRPGALWGSWLTANICWITGVQDRQPESGLSFKRNYSLIGLEARNVKSRCWQACAEKL